MPTPMCQPTAAISSSGCCAIPPVARCPWSASSINANGDLLYTFTRPWSDGTTGIRLSPLELSRSSRRWSLCRVSIRCATGAAWRRIASCGRPSSRPHDSRARRSPKARLPRRNWSWARLLKRVFAMDMERCPVCQQGRLRIIAAITEDSVIQKILRHLKLAVDPPPIAPAQQAAFAWDISSP